MLPTALFQKRADMAAAFRKAAKSRQREHRERSQPSFRKHLGLLEKKKDYKLRADDYRHKQEYLRALRKKALEKIQMNSTIK